AIYGRDRNITSNANQDAWGGFDNRSFDFPGVIGQLLSNPEAPLGFRLIPKLFFSGNSPPPHSAPNVSTSPYYTNKVPYPDGNFAFYNWAAVTASVPTADRQSFYGSFTRDICDKYLTVFADFKYTRSFLMEPGRLPGFPRIHSRTRTVLPLVLRASVCQSQIRLIPSRSRMRLCPMARLLPPEFISAALKTQAALHSRPRSTTCCSMPDFAVRWESLAITSRIGIGNWVSVILGTTRKPSL